MFSNSVTLKSLSGDGQSIPEPDSSDPLSRIIPGFKSNGLVSTGVSPLRSQSCCSLRDYSRNMTIQFSHFLRYFFRTHSSDASIIADKAQLKAWKQKPIELARPLVIIGGFADSILAPNSLKYELRPYVKNKELLFSVQLTKRTGIMQEVEYLIRKITQIAKLQGKQLSEITIDVECHSMGGVVLMLALMKEPNLKVNVAFFINSPLTPSPYTQFWATLAEVVPELKNFISQKILDLSSNTDLMQQLINLGLLDNINELHIVNQADDWVVPAICGYLNVLWSQKAKYYCLPAKGIFNLSGHQQPLFDVSVIRAILDRVQGNNISLKTSELKMAGIGLYMYYCGKFVLQALGDQYIFPHKKSDSENSQTLALQSKL